MSPLHRERLRPPVKTVPRDSCPRKHPAAAARIDGDPSMNHRERRIAQRTGRASWRCSARPSVTEQSAHPCSGTCRADGGLAAVCIYLPDFILAHRDPFVDSRRTTASSGLHGGRTQPVGSRRREGRSHMSRRETPLTDPT